MGGAQSHFNDTDWDLADGSLHSSDQTIDGSPPTASYKVYELVKRSLVANQREFDVTDSEKNLLFHVRPSPGTIAGFDILGIGSANNHDYKLRVTVDLARRYWVIYRFDKPIFDGQKPDPIATNKFAIEQQQQQSSTNERKELAARISASLAIHSFSDDTPIEEQPPPPPIKPKHFLYKVGCVTVSWSRYMAVAAYYGPPTIEQIMLATEAACKNTKPKSKNNNTATTSNDTDDEDGDILQEAAKIAGRLREKRGEIDDSESSDIVINGLSSNNEIMDENPNRDGIVCVSDNEDIESQLHMTEESTPVPSSTEVKDAVDVESDQPVRATIDNSSPLPSTNEVESGIEVGSYQSVNDRTDTNNESINHGKTINKSNTVTSIRNHSLADDLVDESEQSSVDDNHADIAVSLSHDDRKNNSLFTGNETLDIPTSTSMPELSPKASKSPRMQNGLQKWWKESSRTLQEKSIAILRPMGLADDEDTPTATPTIADNSSNHSRGGTPSNNGGASSFLGKNNNNTSVVDDPLQGVIHLDKPLLLCQEIYTRIIGNHQTSKVSKEKVLTLLRQDMEQHIQNVKDDEDNDDMNENNDVVAAVKNDCLSAVENEEKLDENNQETSSSVEAESNESGASTADDKSGSTDDIDSVTKPNEVSSTTEVESTTLPTTDEVQKQQEQPLVGYWAWENTLRTHKMKMHLAKGSDLALHVVLAVLVNQLRYERNAIAMAV